VLAVALDLLCWLQVSELAKMRPVYLLIDQVKAIFVKNVLMVFRILLKFRLLYLC
jgi:hypothetical protein